MNKRGIKITSEFWIIAVVIVLVVLSIFAINLQTSKIADTQLSPRSSTTEFGGSLVEYSGVCSDVQGGTSKYCSDQDICSCNDGSYAKPTYQTNEEGESVLTCPADCSLLTNSGKDSVQEVCDIANKNAREPSLCIDYPLQAKGKECEDLGITSKQDSEISGGVICCTAQKTRHCYTHDSSSF